jgi:hypothetical protein
MFISFVGRTVAITIDNSTLSDQDFVYYSLFANTFIMNGSPYVYPFSGYTGNLTLVWNNIANVPVANPSSVSDWNTFFNLPPFSTPFTSVSVVGNSVTLIGGQNIGIRQNRFTNNSNLVQISDSGCVAYLERQCFQNCGSLTSISFASVTVINFGSFSQCPSLASVNLPSVTTIGNQSFYYCTSLVSINAPSLLTLSDQAFAECTSLTSVSFPNLLKIGIQSFRSCTSLTNINIPSCINLGPTVNSDGVFSSISQNNITLTIPAALMTADAGDPDGDIIDLQDENTVTIVTV